MQGQLEEVQAKLDQVQGQLEFAETLLQQVQAQLEQAKGQLEKVRMRLGGLYNSIQNVIRFYLLFCVIRRH